MLLVPSRTQWMLRSVRKLKRGTGDAAPEEETRPNSTAKLSPSSSTAYDAEPSESIFAAMMKSLR